MTTSPQEDLFATSPVAGAPTAEVAQAADSAPRSIDAGLEDVSIQARSAFLNTLEQVQQLPRGMELEEQRLLKQMEELMEQTRLFEESRRRYLEGDSEAFSAYSAAATRSPEVARKLFDGARGKISQARTGVVEAAQALARNPLIQKAQEKGNNFIERALEGAERMSDLDGILLKACGTLLEKAENKGRQFYQRLSESFSEFCEKAYGPVRALQNKAKAGLTVAAAVVDTAGDIARPVASRALDLAREGVAALGESFRKNLEQRRSQEADAPIAIPTAPTAKL